MGDNENFVVQRTVRLFSWVWERYIAIAIVLSIIFYYVEVYVLKTSDSRHSPDFFLWAERVVALILTAEYIVRWWHAENRRLYPVSAEGIIDALSFIPFYVGFFVPESMLGFIRALRLLRMLKLYRYNPAMQTLVVGLKKARPQLMALGSVTLLVLMMSSSLIYELEKQAQPDKFQGISDGVWWSMVTFTTIGYGDLYPVTLSGRVLAIIVMTIGVALSGAFIGIIGSAMFNAKKAVKATTVGGYAPEQLQAAQEGADHFRNGGSAEENPYKGMDQERFWYSGFVVARDKFHNELGIGKYIQ